MARTFTPPTTMRTWQYTSTTPSLASSLTLTTSPLPTRKPNQHLIQILHCALNPIDYRPASIPILGRILVSRPATPCIDFSGIIVIPATGSDLKPGDRVCGISGSSPLAGGALREFNVAPMEGVVRVPEGVDMREASGVGVAGLTALQSVVGRLEGGKGEGKRVFINGGSGGVGMWGMQIARVVGCEVTASCSGRNEELVRGLGASEVIDYTKEGGVVGGLRRLKKEGKGEFDLIADNVGTDEDLVWGCGEFLKKGRPLIKVSADMSLHGFIDGVKRKITPRFLGGVSGKVEGFWPKPNQEDLTKLLGWMAEGKVKGMIDETFAFEDAPKAFEKLMSKRARGKIMVDVAPDTWEKAWSR